MQPLDRELLRELSAGGSTAALHLLLDRYLAFVYSAARRQVELESDAIHVTAAVFQALSRCARRLPPTDGVGWLVA